MFRRQTRDDLGCLRGCNEKPLNDLVCGLELDELLFEGTREASAAEVPTVELLEKARGAPLSHLEHRFPDEQDQLGRDLLTFRLAVVAVYDLAQGPGIALRASSDHHCSSAGRRQHGLCPGPRSDVSARDHGYVDQINELGSERMICGPRVHLPRRARMQGQRCCACVHQPWPHLEAGAGAVLESSAHLDGDRSVHGLGDRRHDPTRAAGILEERCPGAGLRHLLDRAPEVDVHDVGPSLLDHVRSLGHQRGLRAEDLHGERVLVRRDSQVVEGALVAVMEPGAADHLRAHESGTETAALAAKCLHAYACHRRQNHAGRYLNGTDPPRSAKIKAQNAGGIVASMSSCEEPRTPVPFRPATAPYTPRDFFRRGPVPKEVILTKEGYEKLKQEIDFLSSEKRREVAERIRTAREFGDITENSEYDDAKNEQALVEHRIALLEERLLSARVIDKKDIAKDVVSIGSMVKLRDMGAGKTVEYRIVGSAEANPTEQKLSNESPVGKAIIGRKKGEVVEVSAPRGALKFKILDIKAA